MFVLVTLCAPSHFSRVQLWPSGLRPARLLCPWDSPGKNTGVGCHALFQWIFQTQGSNSHLLRLPQWQADFFVFSFSSPLSNLGSPVYCIHSINSEYASVHDLPVPSTFSFPLGVHTFDLYTSVSISALQTGSSEPSV